MADRAIWSGAISFGMVMIPVKLYSATRSKDISFHLLHATCGARLEQKRWCPVDDVEVPWDEVARGYEYAKGRHVVLTDLDFEQLPVPSKQMIELSAFVEQQEIDPVFYEKSYYLAPGERGEKPYALLLRALEEKGLTAVATVTLRKKEQLCALRPQRGALMLETLYYPDEVSLDRTTDLGRAKVGDRELAMAFTLIDLLRKPFRPEEYEDHYRTALAAMIDAKLEGKEVVTAPPPGEAKVLDLVEALARSVRSARRGRAAASKAEASAPTAPRRKRKAPPARRRRASA
jgi:DNA end-binding protein Ku